MKKVKITASGCFQMICGNCAYMRKRALPGYNPERDGPFESNCYYYCDIIQDEVYPELEGIDDCFFPTPSFYSKLLKDGNITMEVVENDDEKEIKKTDC